MFKFRSITTSLLVAFLLLAIVPLVAVAMFMIGQGSGALQDQARSNLLRLVEAKVEALNLDLRRVELGTQVAAHQAAYLLQLEVSDETLEERLQNYARNEDDIYCRDDYYIEHEEEYEDGKLSNVSLPSIIPLSPKIKRQIVATEALDGVWEGISSSNPNTEFLYLITAEGMTRIYPWWSADGDDDRTEDHYLLADEEHNPDKKPIWTELDYTYNIRQAKMAWMVTNSMPVYDDEGHFLGVMCHDVVVVDKEEIYRIPLALGMGEESKSYGFLVGEEGEVIVHPRAKEVTTEEGTKLEVENESWQDVAQRMADTEEGPRLDSYEEGGEEYVVAFTGVAGTGWILGVAVPEKEVMHRATRMRNIVIGVTLVVIVLVIGEAFLASRSITGPIQRLSKGVEIIDSGRLDHRIEVETANEIGQLAQSFSRMTVNLRSTIEHIRQAALRIGSSSEQIAATVMQQAGTSAQQATAAEQTKTTMEEVAATSGQIAEGAEEVVEAAAGTQGDAQRGVKIVNEIVRKMEEIKKGNEASAEEIMALGRRSQQIGEVMDIINDITDQTKLIAFNAALEAAAAGEAGRRFGVVATEVRRLADTVTEATEEIRERIDDIQTATNELAIASEQRGKRVEEGVAQAEMMAEALQEILHSSEVVTISARQIALSTQQQRTAAEQVVEAAREVSLGAKQMADGSQDTTQVVNDLVALAEELQQTVKHFSLDSTSALEESQGEEQDATTDL